MSIVNSNTCTIDGCGSNSLCGFCVERITNASQCTEYTIKTHDPVNNPSHYDLFADGTESMDVIRATLSIEEFAGFLKGNCLKYRLRAGKKDNLQQDIDKANWYENKLREVINNGSK